MIGPYRGPFPCPTCGKGAGVLDFDAFAEPLNPPQVSDTKGQGSDEQSGMTNPKAVAAVDLVAQQERRHRFGLALRCVDCGTGFHYWQRRGWPENDCTALSRVAGGAAGKGGGQ